MDFSLACRWVAAQSVFYHLYNQVSYMSLDEISPLTFSVGNTMKRISVIVASIIIFRTPVQPINALGAAIAILGTFIYSQVIHLTRLTYLTTYVRKQASNSEFDTKTLLTSCCRQSSKGNRRNDVSSDESRPGVRTLYVVEHI